MKTKNSTLFGPNSILDILARAPEAKTPVFSCFVNLEDGKEHALMLAESSFLEFRRTLPEAFQHHADEALEEFEFVLSIDVESKSKGFAFYFRTGSAPFCHWVQLQVPLKTSFVIGQHPVLLPLLELQDRYDRYFVLISTHEKARILEIQLGEAIDDKRLGQGWERSPLGRSITHRHYQTNMADRGDAFFDEKIAVISKLLEGSSQKRLILAGYPENIKHLRERLPRHLQQYILDELPLCDRNDSEKIVTATLETLVKQEMLESESMLREFHEEYEKDGLVVLGTESCREAILSGLVDTLLVTQASRPSAPIWKAYLKDWQSEDSISETPALFETEKEEILRLALENDIMVEFVQPDWLLDAHQGVGALLRYRSTSRIRFVPFEEANEQEILTA